MMVRTYFLFYFFILLYCPLFAQTYIVNTNVLDVENRKLLTGQTVVIKDDKILNVDKSSKIKSQPGSSTIDGAGKFLIPGLVDAHVHFFQSGGLYTRPDVIDLRKYTSYQKEIEWTHRNMEDLLQRYIQAGITTVIDVGSTINFLIERDTFKNKRTLPVIYMTGPLLTTWEPEEYLNLGNDEPFYAMKNEIDARELVRKQLPFKPDFIKIWYIVTERNTEKGARETLPLIKAVIDEAHIHNLKVAVHATERITAQLAVESGCDFLVHGVDDEIVDNQFLQLLKSKKVILCPTLSVADNYNEVLSQEYKLSYTDFIDSNPDATGSLFDLKHIPDTLLINDYKKLVKRQAGSNRFSDSILRINLKKMVNAGITIATGTDAGNIGTLHATSYYEELQNMNSAGLSLWQILQASTINGAKILNKDHDFGSITAGKIASMVLLNANPLESIKNWQKIELVFNRGIIIKPDSIVKESPVMLVQKQLNGYNGHNIEGFLEPYAEDVEVFTMPQGTTMMGKQHLRTFYETFLKPLPDLHCEIKNRIIKGNIIIDHQKISGLHSTSDETIAIYLIEENKIKKVYLFN